MRHQKRLTLKVLKSINKRTNNKLTKHLLHEIECLNAETAFQRYVLHAIYENMEMFMNMMHDSRFTEIVHMCKSVLDRAYSGKAVLKEMVKTEELLEQFFEKLKNVVDSDISVLDDNFGTLCVYCGATLEHKKFEKSLINGRTFLEHNDHCFIHDIQSLVNKFINRRHRKL